MRFLGAGSTGDGAAVQLTAPRSARFDHCDFMGNQARDGGAGAHWGCLAALGEASSLGGLADAWTDGSSVKEPC